MYNHMRPRPSDAGSPLSTYIWINFNTEVLRNDLENKFPFHIRHTRLGGHTKLTPLVFY